MKISLPSFVVWRVIATILVAVICFAGCSNEAADKETRTNDTPDYLRIPEIKVHISHLEANGLALLVSGTTGLQDGTRLQALLYEDDTPVPWWDSYQTFEVKDGKFDIQGYMPADGLYRTLSKGPSYALRIWDEANSTVNIGGISFDLVGPMPITT